MSSGKFEKADLNGSNQFSPMKLQLSGNIKGNDFLNSGQTSITKATINKIEEEKEEEMQEELQDVLAKVPKVPGMMTVAKRKPSMFDK